MTERVEPPQFAMPLHEAIFWRGIFVHRYSGAEQTLTELLVRCWADPDYRDLGPVPSPWERKLARFTQIIDRPGKLQPYAERLRDAFQPIVDAEQERHLLVHGMMSLDPEGDRPRTLFIKTYRNVDGQMRAIFMWVRIEQLVDMTQIIGSSVEAFTRLVGTIFREANLCPSAEEDPELMVVPRRVV